MTKFRTHYDNLQISRSASLEVIKSAYRTLSAKYHPDRNLGDARCAEIMSIINNSYAVLSDEGARRQHDAWIRRQEAARSSRPGPHAFSHPETSGWHANGPIPEGRHWSSDKSVSAATEAALAQGRWGKFAALLASAIVACLLVLALYSEQQAGTRPVPDMRAPGSAAPVRIPQSRDEATVIKILAPLPKGRDDARYRALEAATTFAKRQGLLPGQEYAARIHDEGDEWLISYRPLGDRGGGASIVTLDKRSLLVTGQYGGNG